MEPKLGAHVKRYHIAELDGIELRCSIPGWLLVEVALENGCCGYSKSTYTGFYSI